MINNCYDLLAYIKNHSGNLHIPADTESELGINRETFDTYIDELVSHGYVKLYIRSCGITPEGSEFLNDN